MHEDITPPSISSSSLADLGRGTLFQMLARISMVAASYLLHLVLGRLLGPVRYGTIGTVLSIMTTQRTVVVNVTRQTVSKYVAEERYSIGKIRLWSMVIQCGVTCGLSLICYLLAGPLAQLADDPVLGLCLRISTLFIPIIGWYAIQIATLNGIERFAEQGLVIFIYNVARAMLALTGVYLFTTPPAQEASAILGLAVAPLVAGIVAQGFYSRYYRQQVKKQSENHTDPAKDVKLIRGFVLDIFFSALGITILLNSGQVIVKALSPNPAQAGYYTAASAFGLVPHAILLAFSDVIVPVAVRTTRTGDTAETANMIIRTCEYMLWIMFLVLALTGASASTLVTWVYQQEYLPAAPIVIWSCAAFSLLAIYMMLSNAIATTFSSRFVLKSSIGVVCGTIILGIVGLRIGDARGLLIATTGVLAVALAVYMVYLRKHGSALNLFDLRWPIACAVVIALAMWLAQPQREMLLPMYAVLSTGYLAGLWFSGTINDQEKQAILHYSRNILRTIRR